MGLERTIESEFVLLNHDILTAGVCAAVATSYHKLSLSRAITTVSFFSRFTSSYVQPIASSNTANATSASVPIPSLPKGYVSRVPYSSSSSSATASSSSSEAASSSYSSSSYRLAHERSVVGISESSKRRQMLTSSSNSSSSSSSSSSPSSFLVLVSCK